MSTFTEPYVLSLDIGSSSVRAIVFDRTGRTVDGGNAHRKHRLQTSPDGKAVSDPDELLGKLFHCIDEVLSRLGDDSRKIAAVGSCTFVSNVLGVNQTGVPVTPLYTYADSRPAEDANTLRAMLDESFIHQQAGTLFHPSYLPARFLWLKRTRPELFGKVARWLSIGEYMTGKLFGQTAVSYSVASWSGLLNRHTLDWDEHLLADLPVSKDRLSPLVDVDSAWKGLKPPFDKRWPALSGIPWYPAVGDGATANLGSGCVSPDRFAITMGTSSAVRVVLRGNIPVVPHGLWSYRVDKDHSLVGGALSEGGCVYEWLTNTLKPDERSSRQQAIAAIPPDSHGLTFLPLLAGERSPGWNGNLRGALLGISLATTPQEILRAAMEGVAYRISLIYQLLEPSLPADTQAIANGGALHNSPAWVQIIADVLGRPVSISLAEEPSARGAAMLALRSLGVVPDLASFPPLLGKTCTPNPAHHAIYQKAIQRQKRLYGFIQQETSGE